MAQNNKGSLNSVLHDSEGRQILPKTTANNVYIDENTTLKDIVEQLKSGVGILPIASADSLGVVKVGKGLKIEDDGTLNCTAGGSISGVADRTMSLIGNIGLAGKATYLKEE